MPQLSASGYYYCTGDGGVNYHPTPTPLYVSGSSSFVGEGYATILGPVDVSKYSNYKVFVINNSVNNLKTGSLEVSANGTNWEILHSASFSPLTSSGYIVYQTTTPMTNVMLRFRGWASGSGGGITGSLWVALAANN